MCPCQPHTAFLPHCLDSRGTQRKSLFESTPRSCCRLSRLRAPAASKYAGGAKEGPNTAVCQCRGIPALPRLASNFSGVGAMLPLLGGMLEIWMHVRLLIVGTPVMYLRAPSVWAAFHRLESCRRESSIKERSELSGGTHSENAATLAWGRGTGLYKFVLKGRSGFKS